MWEYLVVYISDSKEAEDQKEIDVHLDADKFTEKLNKYGEAGWELVDEASLVVGDSRVKDVSDISSARQVTSDDGTVSFLMKIKKEYYEEDQASKRAINEEQERALQTDASSMGYGTLKQSAT